MGGLVGLFRSDPQVLAKTGYAALSDEALLGLIFTEGDRLPMEFAQEAISRGDRLVPALADAALEPRNHDRGDAGWCSAIHACFLLGAIGGTKAAEALLEAFDISDDFDNDWINEEWASIFGRLGPLVLEPLKGIASEYAADCYFRHRAMSGLAAVALRHPELKADVFDFIAGIASDLDDDPEGRLWAGDILLDFHLKEHEGLLLTLAELPENDVYHPEDVREALAKKDPDLYWYQRDWLDFYSEKKRAERMKRWEGTRLSEDEAWQSAVKDLEDEDQGLPLLSRKQAERMLGELLPVAQRIKERMEPDTSGRSKDELRGQYALAMELHAVVREDRSRFRVFDGYLEDLLGWLTPLAINMAAEGMVDEGASLGRAWAEIRASEVFLGDRALILAEAGREAQAREQLAANLKVFSGDVWIQIKAGHAYEALKDFSAAESCYRTARVLAHDDDRDEATRCLIEVLKQAGKPDEAHALESQETQRRDEARRWAQESRASWEPVVRQGPKIGRNEPCPCGSGKKFKKCCLDKESTGQPAIPASA